ncbi:MAG: hypothetical protein Q9221_007485 [Calogaya cf. arnoldii]
MHSSISLTTLTALASTALGAPVCENRGSCSPEEVTGAITQLYNEHVGTGLITFNPSDLPKAWQTGECSIGITHDQQTVTQSLDLDTALDAIDQIEQACVVAQISEGGRGPGGYLGLVPGVEPGATFLVQIYQSPELMVKRAGVEEGGVE